VKPLGHLKAADALAREHLDEAVSRGRSAGRWGRPSRRSGMRH